jgi:putative ABC transport system substrate-binding protein
MLPRSFKVQNRATCPSSRPAKFTLVLNLKTAKRLGVSVPPTLQSLADEVIEWSLNGSTADLAD